MANKLLKTRMQQKIDTSQNWAKATNFVPLKGEICIYSDLHRMKVGDGTTKIGDLDFFETVASSTTLGSIKADTKTGDDVLPVHIDTDGKLWASQFVDATADYEASGAASMEQWATMAAETEDADDDAEATYRVNAGRYRIAVTADQEASDVTIMDVPDGTGRIVLISHINSDPFWYFDVYGVSAPGGDPESLLSLSTEEGLLNFGDGCVRLLPGYDKSADSDDADKILMLKRSTVGGNTSVNPQWVALTNVAEEGA